MSPVARAELFNCGCRSQKGTDIHQNDFISCSVCLGREIKRTEWIKQWLDGISSEEGRNILLSLSLREMSGLWHVNTLAEERKTIGASSHHGCCPCYEALHFKLQHTTKNAAFPFILLVITVKQVCLIFLLLIWDEPLVCCFVYPPLMIALDVFKQQLGSKCRQALPVIDCDR